MPTAATDRPGEPGEAKARWFGDPTGRPGSLVAILERPAAPQGRPGIGGSHHFALAVPNREVLLMWKRRFLDEGYAVNGILDRHYFQSIYIKDPDGPDRRARDAGPGLDDRRGGGAHRRGASGPAGRDDQYESRPRAHCWRVTGPKPCLGIAPAMRILGLHHVTAIGTSIEGTEAFVAGRLGMRRVKRTNNFDDVGSFHWYWGVGGGAPGDAGHVLLPEARAGTSGGDGRWSDRALRGCRSCGRSRAVGGDVRGGRVARFSRRGPGSIVMPLWEPFPRQSFREASLHPSSPKVCPTRPWRRWPGLSRCRCPVPTA